MSNLSRVKASMLVHNASELLAAVNGLRAGRGSTTELDQRHQMEGNVRLGVLVPSGLLDSANANCS